MILGSVTLKKRIRYTEYKFGNIKTLQDKILPIMENNNGILTCVVKNGGLVEVDVRDIKTYELYKKPVDPFELVETLMSSLGCTREVNSPTSN